jgi:hypothetical protein
MRAFFVTVALLLAVVVAVNGLAALETRAHQGRVRAAAAKFVPGQVLLGYRDRDERRFQQARLEVIPPPRLVTFGSSRVMPISTAMVGTPPATFYNAGLSAASVEDFIVLWSVLERRERVPGTALFSIDSWAFNRSHPQLHWLEWQGEVNRFVDASHGTRASFGTAADRATYGWYQGKELLSYTVFKTSLQELNRIRLGRSRRGQEVAETLERDLVPERDAVGVRALRADGSIAYERAYLEQPLTQVRAEAQRFARVHRGNLENFVWDAERARRLELLWSDMLVRHVRLIAYMPPYHPAVWDDLNRDARIRSALEETAAFLGALARKMGVRFENFADPASVPCAEEEFLDGSHARDSCLTRIVHRMLR